MAPVDDVKSSIIYKFVPTQYRHWTDRRRTDGPYQHCRQHSDTR